jgi:hypothetical protein
MALYQGPLISVNQGDTLEITLVNNANTVHSLDFHAGYGPSQALSGSLEPSSRPLPCACKPWWSCRILPIPRMSLKLTVVIKTL